MSVRPGLIPPRICNLGWGILHVMAILIDPPTWPAHGTLFSHLVSDASFEELHEFAAKGGVSGRAFDRDHYDVPLRMYDDLIELGAVPVPSKELVQRLIASGLRRRKHLWPSTR